jgi:hypothetical protein
LYPIWDANVNLIAFAFHLLRITQIFFVIRNSGTFGADVFGFTGDFDDFLDG